MHSQSRASMRNAIGPDPHLFGHTRLLVEVGSNRIHRDGATLDRLLRLAAPVHTLPSSTRKATRSRTASIVLIDGGYTAS